MNAESSRSHLIIGIVMESTNKNTGNVTKGKVCYYIRTYLDRKDFCIGYFLWYKMAVQLYCFAGRSDYNTSYITQIEFNLATN